MSVSLCYATEEQRQNARIEAALRASFREMKKFIKLLLLGTGGSGKSTIFKQLQIIHKNAYTPEECKQYVDLIYKNTLQAIRTLIEQAPKFNNEIQKEVVKKRAEQMLQIPEQNIQQKVKQLMSPNMGKVIYAIWQDPAIQKTFECRAKFQLEDSAKYFLDNVQRLCQPDYVPTQQDVLRSRLATVGVAETDFVVDGNKFKMVDVGGQRNERRKWIHSFDDVTAIIFVVSLSDYDQVLFEDETQNRMTEALLLFDEIINSRYFRNTSIITFFNKKDLYEEKIKKVDLKVCFSDYTGGCNYENGIKYIVEQFYSKDKFKQKKKRQLYHHITCATDTNNIRVVFNAIKNIVMQEYLRKIQQI